MTSGRKAGLPDAAARTTAATELGQNLVVLAGAGTGKTSLLVERVLNAVGSGTASLRELAAITFTEKAAGEMRQRMASALDRLRALCRSECEPDGLSEADRSFGHLHGTLGLSREEIALRALEAMEQLDHAVVVTIHSFCSQLIREYPLEAGADPGFAVDTGEQAEALRRLAWDRFLEQELGPDAERAQLWQDLLDRVPLSSVGAIAQQMADFAIPDDLLKPPFESVDPRVLYGDELNDLVDDLDQINRRAVGMTPNAAGYFQTMQTALTLMRDEGIERFSAEYGNDEDFKYRIDHDPKANKALRDVTADQFNRVSKAASKMSEGLLKIDETASRLLLEAVSPFVLSFREDFLAQGFLSFDGLLVLARDLLRDNPAVRRSVKQRFRMLLVDEFQDTDPLQYEIVLFLAEREDENATDAHQANLEPGRLFVVGDAKQSIYRFRGADYVAYRRTVERIVEAGGSTLDLTSNFRSLEGVLEPVNDLLAAEDGCWSESTFQPPYVPIRAVRSTDDSAPSVEIWTVGAGEKAKAGERREAEGRVLAQQIRQLVEDDRSCTYAEITILFRAFTNISLYLRPLRELGIPFVVDGGKEFLERPEVGQLMALLRAITQPEDAPAVLAYLRSPAGAVPDTVLAEYAAAGGRWDWRRDDLPDGFDLIDHRFRLLRELARECRDLPADAAIRRAVRRTSLLPLGAAAFEGAQRVANLRKLATAAGDLARDGRLSLQEVVEGLREGRLIDIKTDSPIADEAAEAVRITSIHRMKGLENRLVFLPDFAREPHRGQTVNEAVRPTRLPDGRSALAVRAHKKINGTAAWLESMDRQHELAEEVRVLYVALTRARDRLVVLTGPSRGTAPWIAALSPWDYQPDALPDDGQCVHGGRVLHRSMEPAPRKRREEQVHPVDISAAVERHERAVERLRGAARPPFRAPSVHDEAEPTTQPPSKQASLFEPSRQLAKAAGILVHRWLEGWDGKEGRDGKRLKLLTRSLAENEGLDSGQLSGVTSEILDAFLDSELAQRFRSVKIVGREVPLLLAREDGSAYRGSIDLLYRDVDETVVVADFKTDRESDPEALRTRYAEQLGIYAQATQAAWNLEQTPRREIWWLRGGQRLVLD